MAFGDEDLAAAFRGPGTVTIIAGADEFQGFRDEDSADVLTAGGEYTAQALRDSVLVITTDVPSTLAIDDEIEVDGQAVKVRQLAPVDDGRLTLLIYVPKS